MLTLKELRAQRAKLAEEADAIIKLADTDNAGAFTEEQQTKFDALHAELGTLKTQIDNRERQETLRAEFAAPASPGPSRNMPATATTAGTFADPIDASPGVVPATNFAEPKQPVWSSMGEMLLAVHRAAGGNIDPRLQIEAAASGASEGIASDGGFLVNTDMASGMLKRIYDIGAISSRVSSTPISPNSNGMKMNGVDETSRAAGSRWGGVRGYWVDEADAKTASKPKFRQIELTLRKVCCLFYSTDELLQDSTALESEVAEAVPQELNFQFEDAIYEGLGVGQPLGIMNSGCLVTVAKEAGQAAATIVSENIAKMWARLWARSQQNSVWLVNQDVFPELYNLALVIGTGGSPLWSPPGGISASPYSTLMGRPVIPVEYASTLGTVGDIMLADLSQYKTITKGGIQAASSIHVRFVYDESAFRWVLRVDGQPAWSSALTPFKGTNTVSPFVVLATRA